MQQKKIYVVSFTTRTIYSACLKLSHQPYDHAAITQNVHCFTREVLNSQKYIFLLCICKIKLFLEQFLLLSKTTLKTHYNHTPKMGKMWKNWLALFCISILACQLCQQLILTFEKKLTVHYTSGLHKDHISELHDQINVRSIPFPKAPSLEVLLLVIL